MGEIEKRREGDSGGRRAREQRKQRTKANDLKELPSHTYIRSHRTDQIEFKCIKAYINID